MKKFIIFYFFIFWFLTLEAQKEFLIEINQTSITELKPIDFGNIDSLVYEKVIIKNNRSSAVEIVDVKVPTGFFVDISDDKILPNKKIVVYVGLNPDFTEISGDFLKKVVLKTNLIADIEIPIKGCIKK